MHCHNEGERQDGSPLEPQRRRQDRLPGRGLVRRLPRRRIAGLRPGPRPSGRPGRQRGGRGSDDETIIVTATKRETTLLEVPFSINAQTEEDIQRLGAGTIEDLSRNVAGLNVQNLGPGQSQVSIRGVSAGQIIRDQPGVKEQVGVYLDESVISLSLFQPDLDLFDLNRVETLRGPQGTLFGSGSVGGTIRYITNQPDVDKVEGLVEANLNLVDDDSFGGHLKGAINIPMGDTAAIRVVGYHTEYAGFIDARREGGRRRGRQRRAPHRRPDRRAVQADATTSRSRRASSIRRSAPTASTGRKSTTSTPIRFTTTRPAVNFGEREQFLLLDENFEDDTLLADLTASADLGGVELTSVTTYINRDILVSRDASALTGSVSVDLGFPAAGVLLPSNLVDTTDLKTWTQELRLSSSGDGPFQWLIGAFYSDVDRVYAQRLPTPGYDVFTDARFGAGTSAAVANGFPLNSPYNADLPYDIKQKALFGEASYDITEALTATAGLRYYDFKEDAQLQVGRPLLQRRQPDRRDQVGRLLAAAAAQLRSGRQCHRQPPGLEGLPARRSQRSAQRRPVQRPGPDRLWRLRPL